MGQPSSKIAWKEFEVDGVIYAVSNAGLVRSLDRIETIPNRWGTTTTRKKRGKVLTPHFGLTSPYEVVRCGHRGRRHFLVHRLVATHFIPNPHNYPEVNHINNDPLDNYAENLEWCTSAQNNRHASNQGRSYQQILTPEHIDIVQKLYYQDKMTQAQIGRHFGVSQTAISRFMLYHNLKQLNSKVIWKEGTSP